MMTTKSEPSSEAKVESDNSSASDSSFDEKSNVEASQVEVASLPVFQFGQDQWSFVGNHLPTTLEEAPVYDQLAEDIMAAKEEANSTIASAKDDHNLDEITTTDKSDAMVLPLTLCDETLLEEIQSIPDRMGFKIGEVADMISIKNYVLRYWESEFDILNPRKSSNNQRVYSRRDVENAFLIRKLLHRDRFSIEGAKQALKDLKVQVRKEQKVQETYHKIETKIESFHERVESLIEDVRKLRKLIN